MITRTNLLVTSAMLLTGIAVLPCFGQSTAITAESIDPLVQPYIDADIANAISIGVVQGDKSWTRHFGTLSTEANQKPDDSTIYEIGSMSKVFTGILLAHAIESGRVKLDQPIGTLMKDLPEANKGVAESILLRHLATHSSGLPRLPDNMNPADPTNPYADYDRKLLTEFMSKVKPQTEPGEPSGYSNLAVGLLGDLLSAEANTSYEALLKQNIAIPLEMTDTCLTLSAEQQGRLATPHNADRMLDKNWDFDSFAGAGGIRSTTKDMLRFIEANLDPPAGLPGQAMELAWKQHLPAKGDGFAMGLGWHIARDGATRWHNGQTGGYHSMMLVNRDLNTGVVVLCNTALQSIDALAESIIQMIGGMKVEPAKFAKAKSIAAKDVARLQGRYQIIPQFILTVRADEGDLYVQATNQPEFRVYPESATEWKYRVVEASLTFELPEEGECTAVTLHQNGQDMRAPRLDD